MDAHPLHPPCFTSLSSSSSQASSPAIGAPSSSSIPLTCASAALAPTSRTHYTAPTTLRPLHYTYLVLQKEGCLLPSPRVVRNEVCILVLIQWLRWPSTDTEAGTIGAGHWVQPGSSPSQERLSSSSAWKLLSITFEAPMRKGAPPKSTTRTGLVLGSLQQQSPLVSVASYWGLS